MGWVLISRSGNDATEDRFQKEGNKMNKKIALMADAHANPRALKAAIDDAKELGAEQFFYLGDITGYGYDAKTTLQIVRENFDVVLMGNHDAICSDRFPARGFGNRNYDLDRAAAKELSEQDLEWLRGLPLTYADGEIACVHGDFKNPSGFNYILDAGDVLDNRFARDERMLFCAHLHQSQVWQVERDTNVSRLDESGSSSVFEPETKTFKLRPDCHYVINVGSVGHPRIECSIAYVVLDPEEKTVSIRHLPFDFESYKKDMTSAGFSIPEWAE